MTLPQRKSRALPSRLAAAVAVVSLALFGILFGAHGHAGDAPISADTATHAAHASHATASGQGKGMAGIGLTGPSMTGPGCADGISCHALAAPMNLASATAMELRPRAGLRPVTAITSPGRTTDVTVPPPLIRRA